LRILRFDRLIAVSESTKNQMLAKWKAARPISVVYNGVNEVKASTAKAKKGALSVLSFARLSHEKQIDKLIPAFALVSKSNPEAKLLIAGSGPDELDLKAQVAELGLSAKTEFLGYVSAEEAFAKATVLVQLSKWENCSYSILDARMHGLTVLATAVGGNPELLPPDLLIHDLSQNAVAEAILNAPTSVDYGHWLTTAEMCSKIADIYQKASLA
jgi:glycogen(starch) synthase